MDFAQLKELLQLVNNSELREFELDTNQLAVRMSKNNSAVVSKVTTENHAEAPTAVATEPVPFGEPVKAAKPVPSIEPVEVEEPGHVVESPIVGTVYLSPSPDQPVFKQVGDTVKKGEPLCIIEAMKVMNEIKSNTDGIVQEVLVEDGQPIEYGQPLFRIKEEGQ
ncbi:acetyl-CoA carboxylase biotin carboxyl carrier protein [Atopococcus tabaci]|uniref:acetyl-CoA carboxylase biotin carboxyl carrier protein n=1 Tax=Atopococcus tabaci TaxID=269774 RepID=UPI00041C1FA8|nr:acetyl-CoA carboxylase biotin carboxyl carrier protein [Atopococcus tabaci]